MNPYPAKGDIWQDDDGETLLFLTEPSYNREDDQLFIHVLKMNTGDKIYRSFEIDQDSGTLFYWWRRIG